MIMSNPENDNLDALLDEITVDKIGVISLDDCRDAPLYQNAINLLSDAKTVVVLAMEVFPEVIKLLDSRTQKGELALGDLYDRNIEIVNGHLDWQAYMLVKKLHKRGYRGIPLPAEGAPFDERFLHSMLSYKEVARLAGIGITGWHSMLITPEYGSRIRLTCIVTNAPFSPTNSTENLTPCPKCNGACVKICPVSAISVPQKDEPYHVDKYACNAYLNATGGCSECLKICPADMIEWTEPSKT